MHCAPSFRQRLCFSSHFKTQMPVKKITILLLLSIEWLVGLTAPIYRVWLTCSPTDNCKSRDAKKISERLPHIFFSHENECGDVGIIKWSTICLAQGCQEPCKSEGWGIPHDNAKCHYRMRPLLFWATVQQRMQILLSNSSAQDKSPGANIMFVCCIGKISRPTVYYAQKDLENTIQTENKPLCGIWISHQLSAENLEVKAQIWRSTWKNEIMI